MYENESFYVKACYRLLLNLLLYYYILQVRKQKIANCTYFSMNNYKNSAKIIWMVYQFIMQKVN